MWIFGCKGNSGFSARSTAEEVTQGIDGTGLTAIVTGASNGIGTETTRVLALRGVHVVMAVRNVNAGRKVKEELLEKIPRARLDVMEIDLNSLASVRKFAKEYISSGLPLNILINNAGIMAPPFTLSKDNIEQQFAVNHLGPFLLTNLLLETLKNTARKTQKEGRIVNVSSALHHNGYKEGIRFDKINDEASYNANAAYGQSKLCNLLHTNELARRFKQGVKPNTIMVAKKGGIKEDSEEDLTRVPVQAILLADSFAQKFRPITLERPKVLLPLVNVPMIDYTLVWLESAGVEEVFVFCCAHAKQVIDYLDTSKWFGQPNFTVSTIESHNSVSAGDALRLIYERNVIHGDFILISGDTLSNMSLIEALQEHKERRRKDSNAVMTMVIKQSKPSPITHQSRLGTDELIMAIGPDTKQLLYYEDKAESLKGVISLDKALLSENPSISLFNDKQDCYIDICSPEVLSLFTDNFDYQHLRRHFVKGLLLDDIMGYKIFTYEIGSSYAARIDNFRSYDSISKDIIQRWTYPLVPDVQFFRNSATKLERQGMYRASEIGQSRSAQIGPFTVIGHATTIGDKTSISNSVVGESCSIGSNVTIEGCYIWHNVTVEDGCKLKHAILCDGVILKAGAVLEPGVVLSFKVVVGEKFVVPAYSKVSLLQQPIRQDSDEELEYADNSSGIADNSPITNLSDKLNGAFTNDLSETECWATSEVGNNGVGFIWSVSEGGHEEWRYSVAPIPADKLVEVPLAPNGDLEDVNLLPLSGELEPDRIISDSDFDDIEDVTDDSLYFEKEVEATFLRAVKENVKEDHVILEVNSLRLTYNMTTVDCAGALFYSMMKLSLDIQHSSASELVKNVGSVVTKWQKVLKYYLSSIDEEIEVIMKFEEMCLEYAKEYVSSFVEILHLLYDKDIIQEEAILNWASEKEEADEADKVFVKKSEKFIQWLNEASEEED